MLVTHEPAIAQRADRIVEMLDGRIQLGAEVRYDHSAVA